VNVDTGRDYTKEDHRMQRSVFVFTCVDSVSLEGHHETSVGEAQATPSLQAAGQLSVEQPLYERVYGVLAERIASGAWRAGSRLPSERALGTSLGVSRLTLRRALSALERDGLVERGESRGWFAAGGPMSEPPNELLGFSAMAQARGLTPAARVLKSGAREATFAEAEQLGIAPGASIFELERLRMFDEIAIAVNRAILPLARLPWLVDIDFSTASLHASLEARGIRPTTANYVIEVLDADEQLARLLDVPIGKGLLLATGLTRDQNDAPLELGWIAHRPDRYRLRTTLSRRSTTLATTAPH
jgi:GntR family transcriptional regulator